MPRAPLLVDTVQGLIGETVYDPYGRVIGSLVSFESDVDGTVQNIVVENQYKEISFIPSEAVEITEAGRVIVLPDWRVTANRVLSSYQRALKRLRGLEDMYSRGEIPSTVYRSLREKLDKSLARLKDEAKKLRGMITDRMHEIEDSNLKLDRAIANLKVSYIAGEISEKAYKVAIERLRSAKESNAREIEDLKEVKSKLEALETGALAAAKHKEHKPAPTPAATHEEEQQAPKAPAMETIQPIPVKLIEG